LNILKVIKIKYAYVELAYSYLEIKNDTATAEKYIKEGLNIYKDDSFIRQKYGNFLMLQAFNISKNGISREDFEKGFKINRRIAYL
jgi:Tfp pilus assembly protein PilF